MDQLSWKLGARFQSFASVNYTYSTTNPASFDWRKQGECILPVRNQLSCGSCWAFSSTSVLADRSCMRFGYTDLVFAAEDLVLCDTQDGGCNGGSLQGAWTYFQDSGVVNAACMPYPVAPDGYDYDDSTYNGVCPTSCVASDVNTATSGPATNTLTNVMKASTWTQVSNCQSDDCTVDIGHIQNEIQNHGPVQASLNVYNDFYTYSSGVYSYDGTAKLQGGHAIEIIGWDTDSNGKVYWICKNSWGVDWGINGFFHIYVDQCEISDNVVTGSPDDSDYIYNGGTTPITPAPATNTLANCKDAGTNGLCATCKSGYTLESGLCVAGNPWISCNYSATENGWACDNSCVRVTQNGQLMSCAQEAALLTQYGYNFNCTC